MKKSRTWWLSGLFLGALVLCGSLFQPDRVAAQQGDKAVWTLNAGTPILAASSAWIDASAFCGSSGGTNNCNGTTDFCQVVSSALSKLVTVSPAGGVVDARGVMQVVGGGSLGCSIDPFVPIEQLNPNPPITILLPPYTIQLNPINGVAATGTWIVPSNVRIVGTGFQTVLRGATNCCSTLGYMLEMGQPPSQGNSCATTYTGIGIEHLTLMTQAAGSTGPFYGGIDNECAGPSSYVRDVKVTGNPSASYQNLGGNALTIGPGATNSGPYTDLLVLAAPGATNCGSNAPALNCVNVQTQTRGIHGLTCLGSYITASGSAGILVNGSNNSIEDVHVEAFEDGVGLGNTTSSPIGNILVSNVHGGTSCPVGNVSVVNAVHVYGSVTNAAITGVTNDNQPAYSIQDDETGTKIQNCIGTGCASPITSGLYVLGRPHDATTGPYSLFAINPANNTVYGNNSTNVPTWGIGSSTLPQGTCEVPGAIFSYTSSGGGVYVCTSAKLWALLPAH